MKDDELQQRTLLKPSEAAACFDVPLRTIYVWYQMGKIEGIKVNGRSLRIFSKSLREVLESRNHKNEKVGAVSPNCSR
jgi:excisionase family DNA binding protein